LKKVADSLGVLIKRGQERFDLAPHAGIFSAQPIEQAFPQLAIDLGSLCKDFLKSLRMMG
jgi:hypothetical protein